MEENRTKLIRILVLAAVIVAIIATFLLILFKNRNYEFNVEQFGLDETMELDYRNPLTGEPVAEAMGRPQVIAVMVENMVEAWPISGVEDAFLVIEAPTEAAIPRFIAFFQEADEVNEIGPVRSARPYYLDWAKEFDALYAHVGGSPEALNLIAQNGLLDLNEFYNGWYFWRDNSRFAPHNVYTSIEQLVQAYDDLKEKGAVDVPKYDSWKFKDDATELPESVDRISMNFSPTYGDLYEAAWEYDALTNEYVRMQNGGSQLTRDRDEIRANNIAVLATEIEVIDSVGRRRIITVGEGEALIIQDGIIVEATWAKESTAQRLRFFAKETGEEIAFNAGVTWIEVLPTLEQVGVGGEAYVESGL
ncbi:MAG: DUF3048 domain-containing protein [Candidatus Uhrbacteria bacterium]|nr:DUF3048 domain-containing protein [Patescibacteria group bacterium]MBU1907304.1 DUF3048 domain-containing protein [Patescibacteria group bacterium]